MISKSTQILILYYVLCPMAYMRYKGGAKHQALLEALMPFPVIDDFSSRFEILEPSCVFCHHDKLGCT